MLLVMKILADYLKAERGRAVRLARAMSAHPVLLRQWAAGRLIPPNRAPDLELATEGALQVEQLCDRVRWVRVADPAWPHPQGRPCIDVAATPGVPAIPANYSGEVLDAA